MAIADVLKSAGLHEAAESGKKVNDKIAEDFHPSDEGYAKCIQNLSEEEFEAFAVYKAHITLDACNLSNEDMAEQLPRTINNAKIQYMKKYNRSA
jgi:hypothetical protein